MIRAVLLELALAGLVLWAVGWGVVKLWFIIKDESNSDRRAHRQIKREADEAHEDLERFVNRTKQKDPKK